MKNLFMLDPDIVFLNHGSYGACPRNVWQAYQAWQLEVECNPVEFIGRRSAALLRTSRERLAAYAGAAADDLVYLPNATTAVNTVARSITLKPGDEVLTTDLEYGACMATWELICRQQGATLKRVEVPLPLDAAGFAEHMLAHASPRTRVIFTSHITSTTALILPIAALCQQARARGILTVIDGAHAPGQVELNLDALGADFYTGNCHKWLSAPKGVAFLHVRREHHATIQATVVSWGYVGDVGTVRDAFTGSSTLERRLQWQGTRDIAACLAVPAAIDFQQQHDWPAVRQRCHAMAIALMHRMCSRTGLAPIARDEDFAQMAPIPVPHGDAMALKTQLFDVHRIEVPVTQHGGRTFVRVSVQGYNDEADLVALEYALNGAPAPTAPTNPANLQH